MPKVKMICDKCKHEFLCSPIDIKVTNVQIKNQDLLLKYFLCPSCDALYSVFLMKFKDMHLFQETNSYLAEYKKSYTTKNLRVDLRLEHIERAREKYKESWSKLASAIHNAKKEFPGFFTYDKQTKTIYYHEKSMEEKEK